jgi:hypothetical protein
MVIPDPEFEFFHPGFEFFHPGSRIKKIPDPGSASKNLNIFNPKKLFLTLGKIICSSRIRIQIIPPSRIQLSKKVRIPDPDPQLPTIT